MGTTSKRVAAARSWASLLVQPATAVADAAHANAAACAVGICSSLGSKGGNGDCAVSSDMGDCDVQHKHRHASCCAASLVMGGSTAGGRRTVALQTAAITLQLHGIDNFRRQFLIQHTDITIRQHPAECFLLVCLYACMSHTMPTAVRAGLTLMTSSLLNRVS
jgi:hypothetical protein